MKTVLLSWCEEKQREKQFVLRSRLGCRRTEPNMFPFEPGPGRAALGLQARGPGRQLQHPGQEGRRRRVTEAWGGLGKVLLGLDGKMSEPQPVLL